MVKRLTLEECGGILIDVQEFFLAQLDKDARERLEAGSADLVRLFNYLRIPLLFTVERPLETKGGLPESFGEDPASARILPKDFFGLAAEKNVADAVAGLKRRQLVLAGCETDVCILQSCLGLLEKGYDVFVVEDLLFSSSAQVGSAIERMKNAGAVFMTFKTLYYELLRTVESGPHRRALHERFGPFPKALAEIKFL